MSEVDIGYEAIEAARRTLEAGLGPEYRVVPPHTRSVTAALHPKTSAIGALDGSDQQMFALMSDPEKGVGLYATVYCEVDPRHPGSPVYKDGASAPGLWTLDDYLTYHLVYSVPDNEVNRHLFNDRYDTRQILSNTRPAIPPLFNQGLKPEGARREAAKERATAEWLALRAAVIYQAPPGALVLKDGRMNSQIEQAAHWADQTGRMAERNAVRAVGVVKGGGLYAALCPTVRAVADGTDRPFYFIPPDDLILGAYESGAYPVRKTLMVGGRDHTDLGGIGGLWVVFCPDPKNWRSFVIIEFNLYNLHNYRELARAPMTLRQWHAQRFPDRIHRTPTGVPHIYMTDLVVDEEHDIGQLVEPTLGEILWLCEQEMWMFGYPNLLGMAHHDVILTQNKMKLLRRRFQEVWGHSDRLMEELIANEFVDTPHKLHNIH